MLYRLSIAAATLSLSGVAAAVSTGHATPYQVLDVDGPATVVKDNTTDELYCKFSNTGTKSLFPATHPALGPGPGWGAVSLSPTLVKVFHQPSCDTGAGEAVDVPVPTTSWASWPLLPRSAEGTVYAPTSTHLVAIETDPPALRELVAWADVAAFMGVQVGPGDESYALANVGGAIAMPSGELWFMSARRGDALRVVALAPDGTLHLVAQMPAPGDDIRGGLMMAWADTLDAVVIGRQYFTVPVDGEALWRVTFLPASVPFNPLSPPTVHERHLPKWVSTYAVESGIPLFGEAGPLTLDALLALDLDQDGLSGEDEARLGTSQWSADSDGDGALDGVEPVLFGTDPIDPASAPAVTPVSDLAPSTLVNDWVALAHPEDNELFAAYMTSDLVANDSGTGVVCAAGTCFHDDGVALTPTLPDDRGKLSLMLSGEGYVEPDGGGLRATTFGRPGADGLSVDVPDGAQTIAVDAHEIYVRDNTINGLEITRYDGEALKVVDADRWGCPIVATQAELDACGAEPSLADRTQVAWAGYDTGHRALIVLAGNDTEWWLTAVTAKGQARILTPADLGFMNVLVAELIPLPNGQSLVRLEPRVPPTDSARLTVMTLDEQLRPQSAATSMTSDLRGGPTFGEGLFAPLSVAHPFYDDGGHGGPTCFDETCVPETPGGPNIVQYIHTSLGLLWVPRAPRPVDGEAILAVRPFGTTAEGGLWRLGPRGEVGPWLGPDALAALSGGAFGEIETSAIAAVGSDAQGRRLCLVTTAQRAVWELSLAPDHTPTTLVRVADPVSGPVACGYGPDGALAVLAEGPARLFLDADGVATTIALPDIAAPRGLFGFDGRFVVTGAGTTARCVDATTRAVHDTTMRLTALARGPGGTISTVDAFGEGALVDLGALCSGSGPIVVEAFDRGPETLWDLGRDWSTSATLVPSAPRAAIAHAEGGMAYVVGLGEDPREPNVDPQSRDGGDWTLMAGRLLRVRPAFAATDANACLAAIDPVRRDATKVRIAAPRAQVMAMTVLGDRTLRVEGEDWELRGIAHEATPCAAATEVEPMPESEDPPEVAEAEPTPLQDSDPGCAGCTSGGTPLWTMLALMAVRRRRLST